MYPIIHLGNFQIGTYGLCCVLGGMFAVLLMLWNARYFNHNRYDLIEATAFILLGALAGAKLLYIITSWDYIINIFNKNGFSTETISYFMQSGFVFYGGFFGGLMAIILYAKFQKKSVMEYLKCIAPSIPLAHAFGRIGCFMAGCCYGIPFEPPIGIIMPNAIAAPQNIPLFPVQLLESLLNLILAVILQILIIKIKHKERIVYLYLIIYPIIRIFTEQFRYDSERGFFLGFSTSEIISVCILICGVILLLKNIYIKKNQQ